MRDVISSLHDVSAQQFAWLRVLLTEHSAAAALGHLPPAQPLREQQTLSA
jgi:hypothetical protein